MNSRFKKIITISFFLILIIFLTTADYLNAVSKTKITFFTWVPAEEYTVNKELVREYERNNPNVIISYMNDPSGQAMQKLQLMFSAGTPPDVMSIHGAFFIPFVSKGALLELDDLINKSKKLKIKDFYPGLIEACRYKGKLFSLPRYTSVYILFYNKKLFYEENLPYPDYTWTWDDYLNTAKKLTKNTSKDGKIKQYGCVLDFWGARIYPWIWQNDGEYFDRKKKICTYDDERNVEALQFLVDLKYRYKVAPTVLRSSVEIFQTGRAGMFLSGAWDIQNLKRNKKLDWAVAPLPRNRKRATILGMENYAISSKTKNKQLAYDFLAFLLSERCQLIMAAKLDKQPSLIKAGKKYAKNKKGFNREVLVDAIEYGIVPANFEEYNMIEPVVQKQLDLIWLGKKTVKEGLTEATKQVNKIFDKSRKKKKYKK